MFSTIEARGQIVPDSPHPNPTSSYWLQDDMLADGEGGPAASRVDLRASETLPETADYVVIGSGISGASIAFLLNQRRPAAHVVMVEARQACSGATGRNGGHTKSASYRGFLSNEESVGLEDAKRIAKLEYANIKATKQWADEWGISCDVNPCETVDVVLNEKQFIKDLVAVKRMKDVFGEDEEVENHQVLSAEEAKSTYFAPKGTAGALRYMAGSVSAYKFTAGILNLALDRGMVLCTNTEVTEIQQLRTASNGDASLNNGHAKGAPRYKVITKRGIIATKNVVLATNGYTAKLLPSVFLSKIVPLRGQCSAQRPGINFPSATGLPATYSFIYDTGYDYMITRPGGSQGAGDIVIGGGWSRLPDGGASEFGNTDDSGLQPVVSEWLQAMSQRCFGAGSTEKNDDHWGEDHPDGPMKSVWTGIMGTSADGRPLVGQVPGMEGCWISAAFDGHGMALCLKCSEALVEMVCRANSKENGESRFTATPFPDALQSGVRKSGIDAFDPEEWPEWFPRSFVLTEGRLRKMKFEGRVH